MALSFCKSMFVFFSRFADPDGTWGNLAAWMAHASIISDFYFAIYSCMPYYVVSMMSVSV